MADRLRVAVDLLDGVVDGDLIVETAPQGCVPDLRELLLGGSRRWGGFGCDFHNLDGRCGGRGHSVRRGA